VSGSMDETSKWPLKFEITCSKRMIRDLCLYLVDSRLSDGALSPREARVFLIATGSEPELRNLS
jgi:hypothetical protein